MQGNLVTLSSYKDKSPVLIIFWATWCPYCVEEIPRLNKLREQYAKDKLEILAIDIQESLQTVQPFVLKKKMNFTVLLDEDGKVSDSYGLVGVPTLVVVDRHGKGVIATNALNKKILKAIEDSVAAGDDV